NQTTGVSINQNGVGLAGLPGGLNANQGDFYVATGGNQIFLYNKDATATLAQSNAAVNAALNNPQGLALDSAGNVYVANLGAGNILKINPTLTTVTQTYPASPLPGTRFEAATFGPGGNFYA